MPVPDFSPGEVLTAAAMDSIGLWKVASGSIASGTTNFVGCFTSAYNVYEIHFSNVRAASGAPTFAFRMLSGTSAAGTSNYRIQRLFAQATSVGGSSATLTFGRIGFIGNGANFLSHYKMTITNPQLAKYTSAFSDGVYSDGSVFNYIERNNTVHTLANVYDGIQILTNAAATVEGTVTIYGVRP
jgi:hypothetical protein